MANTVYTSQQYQMLMDLSGMLTALLVDGYFSQVISGQLSTKMNRDSEIILLPKQQQKYVYSSLSSIGINKEFHLDNFTQPALKFQFIQSNKVTRDKLKQILENYTQKQFVNTSSYLNHFFSGSLPVLTASFTQSIPSFSVLSSMFQSHNSYEKTHQNLNSLLYYYDKTNIDNKVNLINKTIDDLYKQFVDKLNKTKEELLSNLNIHKSTTFAHSNVDALQNYYSKKEIDEMLKKTGESVGSHNLNPAAHPYIQNRISQNTTLINNYYKSYTDAHDTNRQTTSHNMLLQKNNPRATGNWFILTDNDFSQSDTGLSIRTSYNNKSYESVFYQKVKASGQHVLAIGNGVEKPDYPAYNRVYLDNNTFTMQDGICDKNFTITNTGYLYTTPPTSETNGKKIVNIQWVKQYLAEKFRYSPYDAMIDYAHITSLYHNANYSYDPIFKINVPGYLYFYTGHCSDCDMVVWAAPNPNNFDSSNNIIKLNECFGYNDRSQSTIHFPIYPGTNTYVLLSNDYSSGNITQSYWIFLPVIGVRNTTVNHGKYVTFIKDIPAKHRSINTMPNASLYHQTFNTLTDHQIWKTNFTDWT